MKKTKEQQIIESATKLFKEFGIRKVTVEDIIKRASVSKGTYYKYFSNKLELVVKIIEIINLGPRQRIEKMIYERSSLDIILKEIIIEKMNFMRDYSGRFLNDLYEGKVTGLQEVFTKMQEDASLQSNTIYSQAISSGELDREVTLEYFQYLMGLLQNIFFDPKVIEIYPEAEVRFRVIFNNFFYGVLKSN